jgi:methylthioribulose-1-phosphate dehydratase
MCIERECTFIKENKRRQARIALLPKKKVRNMTFQNKEDNNNNNNSIQYIHIEDHTTLQDNSPPQKVICELMKLYYSQGWVSGTGGGISIKQGDRVYIAPSGLHKERIKPEEIFVLDAETGDKIVHYNPNDAHLQKAEPYKISACKPLFYLTYNLKNAGACIHSHSMSALLATLLFDKEFKVTHLEMIKGIRGHGYHDNLIVPIIENTAHECDLADSMEEAIKKYPNTFAVLVKRHGVYIWGKDWIECKTHAEVYHYLFDAAVKMKQLGFDPSHYPSN